LTTEPNYKFLHHVIAKAAFSNYVQFNENNTFLLFLIIIITEVITNTECRLFTLSEEHRLVTYENLVLRIHLGPRGSK
jgi:hypothetical protein